MDKPMSRPNEPGLWTREGKFYRVWDTGGLNAEEIMPDGFLGEKTHWSLRDLPTANWRKLTAEPAGEVNVSPELRVAGESMKHARLSKQMGLRKFAETCGILPSRYSEFETGCRELNVAEVLKIINVLLPATPSPEVIEGRGQAVAKCGLYWFQESDGDGGAEIMKLGECFERGKRYMLAFAIDKIATFPPALAGH